MGAERDKEGRGELSWWDSDWIEMGKMRWEIGGLATALQIRDQKRYATSSSPS
jgi:hypothetical protein